jgi:hypothetical protein
MLAIVSVLKRTGVAARTGQIRPPVSSADFLSAREVSVRVFYRG